eukprot:TRINITY_DN6068_c0_g1_i2.p1 TRINITY_DN6068_c0_g1~~TRINITY_DN6068_c0_g1_i2.p1  ORF type:complete len:401 (-),score=124.86 TRINITY_DN6068_c0_g1_i2:129-1331(-)
MELQERRLLEDATAQISSVQQELVRLEEHWRSTEREELEGARSRVRQLEEEAEEFRVENHRVSLEARECEGRITYMYSEHQKQLGELTAEQEKQLLQIATSLEHAEQDYMQRTASYQEELSSITAQFEVKLLSVSVEIEGLREAKLEAEGAAKSAQDELEVMLEMHSEALACSEEAKLGTEELKSLRAALESVTVESKTSLEAAGTRETQLKHQITKQARRLAASHDEAKTAMFSLIASRYRNLKSAARSSALPVGFARVFRGIALWTVGLCKLHHVQSKNAKDYLTRKLYQWRNGVTQEKSAKAGAADAAQAKVNEMELLFQSAISRQEESLFAELGGVEADLMQDVGISRAKSPLPRSQTQLNSSSELDWGFDSDLSMSLSPHPGNGKVQDDGKPRWR